MLPLIFSLSEFPHHLVFNNQPKTGVMTNSHSATTIKHRGAMGVPPRGSNTVNKEQGEQLPLAACGLLGQSKGMSGWMW